jgi:ABC-type transport system substrate-binding protein
MSHDQSIRTLISELKYGTINRRALLQRAAALGLGTTTLIALSQATSLPAAAAVLQEAERTIPGPPWEGGTRGGTGRVAWPEDNITFDPPLAYDLGGYYGIANFYRGLLYYGLNTEPQLDLAESMEVAEDAMHYRFAIKKGVTFHNGRELTARDFKFTWERASSPDIGSWVQAFLGSVKGHADFVAGQTSEISGIKVIDDYTLELELDRADVTIPGVLAIPPFYALPSDEVQAAGDDFSFTMGTGPWKLDEIDQSQRVYRASRFENYVYADQLPYLERLEWSWGIEATLQAQRVQTGELDATGAPVPAAMALQFQQQGLGEDQFKLWESLTINWIEFNITRPPFDDKRVRQAFNYAVNKERLLRFLIQPTGHMYPPAILGYKPELSVYDYDPEQARALLKAAGYESGVELEMPIFGGGSGDVEQLIQQDLKEVGVTINLTQDAGSVYDYGNELQSGPYALWTKGWGMGLPDPSEIVNSLIGTDAPSNFGGYGNPEIDRLGASGQSTVDAGERAEIYAEIERLLIEDAPFLFEGVTLWGTLKRPELQNFVWEPAVYEHWDRYWLKQ